MADRTTGGKKPFSFHVPWITILIALAIPLMSYYFVTLGPAASSSNMVMWLSSPFNISQEASNLAGVFYNYILVVAAFLIVELYSRNIADLKDRDFIMDNATLIGIIASYATSLVVWLVKGVPSMGSSIIGFDLLIFFAVDLIDSEFFVRAPEDRITAKMVIAIIVVVCTVIILDSSVVMYLYIHQNPFWYVHLLGGAIFALLFLTYLWFTKYAVNKLEKEVGRGAEATMKKGMIGLEEGMSMFRPARHGVFGGHVAVGHARGAQTNLG
jgi:hypothetical protein